MADEGEKLPPDTVAVPGARTLGLGVPPQTEAPAGSLLLDPRETGEWINGLPMANIGETARQIYRALIDFNRYQMPDLARAKSVELFRKPVDYICHNLRRHFIDVGFPLTEKGWKTAALSRELNAELATSYKLIVEHMLGGEAERFDRKLLVIAMHRALYYLSEVVLQCHLTYSKPHDGLWREINSLFAYALHNHVHRVPIKMKFDDEERISTIEDNYKALLLLSAASPNRMRQTQVELLSREVRRWAPMAQALPNTEEGPQAGSFAIDLSGDSPPVHRSIDRLEGPHVINLDLRRLLVHLRESFEQTTGQESSARPEPARQHLPRPLLRQLIINWTRPPKRRFVRTKLNFELEIVVGLMALYNHLDSGLAESAPPSAPEPVADPHRSPYNAGTGHSLTMFDSSSLSLAPLHQSESIGSDSMSSDSFLNILPFSIPAETAEDFPGQATTHSGVLHQARTLNESAGGYCIDWSSIDKAPKVKVGELIGIAAAGTRNRFSLGVVRWLNLAGGRQLEVGLQIVSNHAVAANLRFARNEAGKRGNTPINALLLSSAEGDPNDQPSIVTSPMQLAVGTRLWLINGAQERLVRLTRLVELNSTFVQFHFNLESRDSGGNAPTSEGFDDLWSNL